MIKRLKKGGMAQRVAAALLGVCVLVYTVYHIASLFGEDISTIPTGVSTEAVSVDGKGYIFRDETLLHSENTGVADYLVSDGDKVSVGQELAKVYEVGGQSAKDIVRLLDSRISILEKSTESGNSLADLPKVNESINSSYYQIVKLLASGNTGEIAEQRDKLLSGMNTYSLLTDENSPVENSLETMRQQRDAILKNGGAYVTESIKESGFFYSYFDGYEDSFTLNAADELTAQGFHALTARDGISDTSQAGTYGKLAHSSEWRLVMKVNDKAALQFSVVNDGDRDYNIGGTYNFDFVENGNNTVPMTLVSVIDDDVEGGKILVFSSSRLPEGFVFGRTQSVSAVVSSISGIYVPASAVHRAGGAYYVFILRGSVVCYRRIDVIYEGSDYFLSAEVPEDDGGADYLGTNELLIISGSNLFDGRILD